MTDWVRASNPTAPITNEAEATAAARASAIAIFLGVLWGIAGIVYLMTAGQPAMEAAMAQAAAESPEMAGMTGIMTQAALWMSVGFVVIQLILGLVQWARPNIVIPIIFLILVLFGLISGVMGMMMQGQEDMPEATMPAWQVWGGLVIMIVQTLLHIAGIRGARQLDKLHFEAANR
jgi:uncharacterized membrane protein